MYENINTLISCECGSSCGSGSGSSIDYIQDMLILKTALSKIPSTLNTTEWNLIVDLVKAIPRLQFPPTITLTCDNVISIVMKVPAVFTIDTLQELVDDVYIY
jgi:hypothetical protein